MKKTVLTIVLCAVLAAVFWTGGYYIGSNSHDDISAAIPREEMSEPSALPAEDSAAQAEEVTYVTRSDVSAAAEGAWTVVSEYETDLTGDSQPDKLTIYTSAESADGEIMWDDGQSWIAEVTDAQGGYYALLNSYVSNGCVYAAVAENSEHDKSVTLIVTNGSGLSLKRYDYSSSGFMESKIIEDAGVNVIYSSVPFYR